MPADRRLERLPACDLPGGLVLHCAHGRRSRLLGLIGLRELGTGKGLLLPRCRSVHTFGMRFAIDLVWLGADDRVLRIDHCVAPRRVRSCRRARAVAETAAGHGTAFAAAIDAELSSPRPVR